MDSSDPGPTEFTWSGQLEDMEPNGYMEAQWAPVWAYGFNGIVPGALLLFSVVKIAIAWRRRRRAEAVEARASDELAAGPAVLKGSVVGLEEGDVAVRLQVEQYGTTEQRGDKTKTWYTKWTEIDRELETHPFDLQLESGQRVRIEPDEDTKLIDDLELVRKEKSSRWLAAQLEDGEAVYAVGELVEAHDHTAGYRGGGKALVMRKPKGDHLLLSTRPLGEQFAGEGRVWKVFAIVLVVGVAIVQALVYDYHFAYFAGQPKAAKVTKRRDWIEDKGSKNEEHHHEVSYVVLDTRQRRTELVEGEDYPKLTKGRIFPVHVVRIFGTDRITVGAGATTHGAALFFPAVLLYLVIGFFLWVIASSKPWYVRERLMEEVRGIDIEEEPPASS